MGSDIEARLRSVLGLNKYQALAYEALLKSGPLKAQEVARLAGIPQQRIYDTLRSLVDVGLVTERDGVFEAVDPAESFHILAGREVARAMARASEIEKLAEELKALSGVARARPHVVMLRGMETVMGAALKSVTECRERPVFMAYKVFDRIDQLLPLLRGLAMQAGPGTMVIVPKGYLERYKDYRDEFERYGLKFLESDSAFIDLMIACDVVLIGVPYMSDAVAVMIRDRDFAEGLRRGVLRAVKA
ncbi:MAG: TrmB family transcriptional regulator [Acidilobus sp.]